MYDGVMWILYTATYCASLRTRVYVTSHQTPINSQAAQPVEIHEDTTHRVFKTAPSQPWSPESLRIKAYDAMSDECVEQWVVNHQWGPACTGTDLSEGLKVDGVWAWVNGSDPAQRVSRERYRPSTGMHIDAAHRYTERNELLFSMRSALSSLGNNTMQRLHVLASAYHMPNDSMSVSMVGQVPAWLDKDEALSMDGRVVLHHDADFFRLTRDEAIVSTPAEMAKWHQAAIPSFNSLAVESQIMNIEGTTSDQLVYYNDDFFTLRELAVSDLTTPLYGPVIKTYPRIGSMYLPAKNPIWRNFKPTGEETGIKRAAWVLGERFGSRPYYYITHHPRSLSLPLLREAALTFPAAFSNTALSRFRAQTDVPVPIQAVFMGSWYIVERHREALLWSWAVAKFGGLRGMIDAQTKDLMWKELAGGESSSSSRLRVSVPVRSPVEDAKAFADAGVDVPTSTEYSFSSKDGYSLSYIDWMWFWNRPKHGYPDLTQGLLTKNDSSELRLEKDSEFKPAKACSISYEYCFGSSSTEESATTFFKRIAFEKTKCGDCMIAALVGQSGVAGIDKFLPAPSVELPSNFSSDAHGDPPHLPLTHDYSETDFSMAHVLSQPSGSGSTSLRTWCARLIQRYQYVLGSTDSEFYKMERATKVDAKLKEVQHTVLEQEALQVNATSIARGYEDSISPWREEMGDDHGPLAFLCLNDDVKETGELRLQLEESLRTFLRSMWPGRMPFERIT